MKKSLICIGVCAVLAACGGGGSGNDDQQPAGNPAPQQNTQSQTYAGTLSFGDTISVVITPSASNSAQGSVTLNFLNSQFGLAGSLAGTYSLANGVYTVSGFQSSGTGVPAYLAQNAGGIGLTFSIDSGSLSGQATKVPNVLTGTGFLSGHVAASSNTATNVGALAGLYSFIKVTGNYTNAGVFQGFQDADSGQMQINPDGTLRVCPSAAYSANCLDDDGSGQADTGTIVADPDQAQFPGAYDLKINGGVSGRVFANTVNGQTTLLMDQADTNSAGLKRTGSWVFQSAQALTSGTYDGTWSCAEPDVSDNGLPLGDIKTITVGISGTTLTPQGTATSSPMTLTYNSTFNAALSQNTPTQTAVTGLFSGLLTSMASAGPVQSALMFLPVSASQIYLLDEAGGNGVFVEGLCTKQ